MLTVNCGFGVGMSLEKGKTEHGNKAGRKVRVMLLFCQLEQKGFVRNFRILQKTKPLFLMCTKKRNPFVQLLQGNGKLFTEFFNRA